MKFSKNFSLKIKIELRKQLFTKDAVFKKEIQNHKCYIHNNEAIIQTPKYVFFFPYVNKEAVLSGK